MSYFKIFGRELLSMLIALVLLLPVIILFGWASEKLTGSAWAGLLFFVVAFAAFESFVMWRRKR